MRQLRKLAAGIAVAAAVAVVASAVPALADPPASGGKQVVPGTVDIVSVGANTDENLFNALSGAWNKTITPKEHGSAHPDIYSWNATVPGSTSTAKVTIVPKKGCATITRPNGSTAGLTALDEGQVIDKTVHCVDFARSSSGRSSTSPAPKVGGVGYVALAKDAVTWAVRSPRPQDGPRYQRPRVPHDSSSSRTSSPAASHNELVAGRRQARQDQGLPPPGGLGHALVLAEEARPHELLRV